MCRSSETTPFEDHGSPSVPAGGEAIPPQETPTEEKDPADPGTDSKPEPKSPELEETSPGPMDPGGGGHDPARILDAYRAAVARLFLAAVEGLAGVPEAGVSSRRVANFLRGNQRPPADLEDAGVLTLFGSLARSPSAWVGEILRRLVESGELEEVRSARRSPSGARGDPPGRVRVSRWGKDALRDHSRSFSTEVLPEAPRLGANPELETRLWDLRQRLAAEEGRAPHSIFSNGTLGALAAGRPRDLAELAGVPGFGEARIRRYGRAVLEVLQADNRRAAENAETRGEGKGRIDQLGSSNEPTPLVE